MPPTHPAYPIAGAVAPNTSSAAELTDAETLKACGFHAAEYNRKHPTQKGRL